ncbi:uncharacterized protein LOC131294186 [Anopheles ziemanni]|uniref:uncharacterized protein LOC131264894 n=1 Tax=Anopheles coustani TaxID=139045 RepID=UPI00265A7334|nr:uncharacterized protein LOC131264894 [Anopheles coustani]XP_058178214.1 uncharacterized protein LOC131294186 [Anopheles ziemanni]
MNAQSRAHRKPPDVEEALSSMLWTPYDNNLSESDSSDESEVLHRLNNNYAFLGPGANRDHRRHPHRQQQSLMRRSLSAWSYRTRATAGGKGGPGELQAGNRFSYPYYDPAALGTLGCLSGGWDGGGFGNNNNNHVDGTVAGYDSCYGSAYDTPVTASSYASIHGPGRHRAPWQTVQTPAHDAEKRPYLQLQTPFVGRWHRAPGLEGPAPGVSPLETSSLPFSLLALDSSRAAGGTGSGDGFADSYRDDYQVYPPGNGNGNIGRTNNNPIGDDGGTCNKSTNNGSGDSGSASNSLCIISAMLKPDAHLGGSSVGDLHLAAATSIGQPSSAAAQLQHHRWLHRKSASTCLVVAQDGTQLADRGRPGQDAVDPIARTPVRQRAEGGEKEPVEPCALLSGLSSVRQANGETSSSSSSSSSLSLAPSWTTTSGSAQKDRAVVVVDVASSGGGGGAEGSYGRSFPEKRPEAMRLNVPAAGLAEGSRTSVYIPSSSQCQSSTSSADGAGGGGGGGGLQALTIQVNRLDPNNQQQNDVVNNPSSGVSIVSCYRAAASVGASGVQTQPEGSVRADNGVRGEPVLVGGDGRVTGGSVVLEKSAVNTSVASPEQMVQVSSGPEWPTVRGQGDDPPASAEGQQEAGGGGGGDGVPSVCAGSAGPPRTYTSTEAQTDDAIQVQPQPLQQAPSLQLHSAAAAAGVGPYGAAGGGPDPTTLLGVHVGGALLMGAPPPALGPVPGLPPGGSEFSTREHRRRERRERRMARNRLQHIHPLEPPPPPGGPGLHHRSPPPIEIIPDILHSHLPPPYTTLPMGASLIPQMIPANSAAAAVAAIPVRAADDCRYTFPIPIMRSSPSERSRKGCCGHWFAGPPLRALIAVVALGGVACALGGAALGATGLAGSPTSHLTAALLMIGVGVILVTVSGAAWRMTAPGAPPCLGLGSTVDLGRCSRRPCGRGGSTPHGLLYPEFQHRPPPPSYQASMQEYRLRLLLLDRDRQSGRMRSTASPPPTYRSNVGSLLRIPLSSRYNNGGSSNSIFGGISGIISGAVGGGGGGGSSNSVNNVPPGADPQVNSSPNGPPEHHPPNPYAEGHSTLPPSYRSVHLGVETLHRQSPSTPQAQPQCSRNLGHTRDDNIQELAGGEGNPNVPDGAAHHTSSIIKIDDRRHSMVPSTEGIGAAGSVREASTKRRSSVPGTSLIDTRSESAAPRNDGGGSDPTHATSYNTGLKDLVTIVTISGTIEPSASGPAKAVYTTSNGSNGGTVPSPPGNGATCTLLNSNSTPLVATVIPVSKSSTGGGQL